MKKVLLGTPSDAAKDIFPVKLDNFGAVSTYQGDEFQRKHRCVKG